MAPPERDTPGRPCAALADAARPRRRRRAGRSYARASGSERSNANLSFASSRPGERVLAREAGVAVASRVAADGLVDAGEREVRERVGAELGGDLLDRAAVGDHLLARGHVDAVVARVLDRRRGDPHVDLARARVAQHLHDLARRVAAHDRVVDDDEALAADDLGQRVELQPQAVLAQLLAGLDERPRDVAVLDRGRRPAAARSRARSRARPGCRSRARRSRGRRPAPAPRARGSRPSARARPAAPRRPCASPGARSRCTRRRRTPRGRPRRSGGCGCRRRRARRARRARRRAAASRR